jgi:DNA end-binding protein Ku
VSSEKNLSNKRDIKMAAPRSIGSLTISFGLVAIPVKLYTATQSAGQISFNLLHKDCGSRLKQQYVCLKDGQIVERDDMVKGYEFAKDQYVAFTPEEIKALDEVGTHSVEISEFVPIESVDPVYFDKTYYLAPDKGAAKPYTLLTEALKESNRCAVGRWATKGKAYIVMLRPVGDVLTMQQLRFASEVRPANEIDVAKTDVKAGEMKLARQLIDQQQAETFDPSDYVDEVRGRIEAAIQKKVEGQEISISEGPAPSTGKVIDLMEALRASLEKTESARASATKLGPRKAAKRVEEATRPARKSSKR